MTKQPAPVRGGHGARVMAGLIGAAMPALAAAQPVPAPPAASPPPPSAIVDQANDIIVTAQRRAQRLEEVPVAISTVSADTLTRAGIVEISEIGRVASGTQVGFGGSYTAPAIRGVTTLTSGNGVENNVAIYFDGFYEPNPLIINQDLINLSGIEILKGPQGTLYGRNATGGAILINTLAPSETFTGKVEGSYARYDDRRVNGFVSGPLADALRFSLAGSYRKSDGYLRLIPNPAVPGSKRRNAAPIKQASVRAKLQADLTENLTATAAFNHIYSNDPRANLYTPYTNRPALIPANDPLTADRLGEHSYNYETTNAVRLDQGTLTLAFEGDAVDLTSRTGYSWSKARNDLDFDGSYRDITTTRLGFRQHTFQQALDASLKAVDGLDLLVGGLYYHDRLSSDPEFATSNYGPNRTLLQRTDSRTVTEAIGFYVDATWRLTDRLSLNGGARYNYENKSVDIASRTATGAFLFPQTQRRAEFRKATPRASIRYEVADRTNVYASWSRGFRPGVFNLSPPSSALLYQSTRAETITAYEVGFKTAQRAFRFDTSAFYYDYNDLQVSVTAPNPTCATCGFVSLFGNAPKARIYGVDGQLSVFPVEGLTLSAGGAYLHARYKDFPNATGTEVTATGSNIGGQVQDWSGKQMARAPTFAGNVSADYRFDFAGGKLALSSNAAYSDSYVISNPSLFGPAAGPALADRQRFRQGRTFLLSAQIAWTDPSDHLTLTAFGTNLTNQRYRLTLNGGNFGTYSSLAQPITYGARAAYSF